jgi:predicted RNase H-like HicB family nuclease
LSAILFPGRGPIGHQNGVDGVATATHIFEKVGYRTCLEPTPSSRNVEQTRDPDASFMETNRTCHGTSVSLKIVAHEAEEGGYWAEAPALPGCASQGETMDELLVNMREALAAWMEAVTTELGAPSPRRPAGLRYTGGSGKPNRSHD